MVTRIKALEPSNLMIQYKEIIIHTHFLLPSLRFHIQPAHTDILSAVPCPAKDDGGACDWEEKSNMTLAYNETDPITIDLFSSPNSAGTHQVDVILAPLISAAP